ncbi:TonB-dependent receptor [Echinicola sp. 20G]|uniref:TonB-dependent receptor n=1 Tax=Echinicola sp. 20G TaxID=2781961 RepID=UPI001910CEA9|nr:TonB-dependent receptor [Echinicola sp. 20G]
MRLVAQHHQPKSGVIGYVSAENGHAIGVTVYVKNTSHGTVTDREGRFRLPLEPGEKVLIVSGLGYEKKELVVSVKEGDWKKLKVDLKPSTDSELDEVEVQGDFEIQNVRESPYNVVAIDAKANYNTNMDLGHLLNRASGVKIRESGGVGSRMNISLNGFTGRNVKIFMDGVPMAGFGNAFQLNNIPVGMADRIEVYKGVVPIEFGTDAMGGVINIVTNRSSNTYLDASYSYGSFNTHRANVSAGHTTKNGFTVQLNAFKNYSDNNYEVYLDKMLDVETGAYVRGDYYVKRFHDKYSNQTVMAKVGFVTKKWADRFLVGITAGELDADIQSASTMSIVYGARTRSSETLLPSVEYYKRNLGTKGLTFRFTGNYNINQNHNVDTAARLYNWYGEFMPTNIRGESGTNTLSDFRDENYSTTANLSYRANEHHSFTLNNVLTGYERKLASSVPLDDISSPADTMRRANTKNVFGASYVFRPNEDWNINLFGKHYYQHVIGPVDTTTTNTSKYAEQSRSFQTKGYGVAATRFYKDFQFKTSIERAFRLPSANELFGDELLTSSNTALKAENSTNFNLGGTMNRQMESGNTLYLDISTYYRLTKDYIQQVQNARYGTISNVNFGRVRNIGVDAEARYYYQNKAMVGGTVTYMDLRNKEKIRDAQSSVQDATYNNRMPNTPYFFGNIDAAYYFHDLGGKGNVLSFNYTFNFVGEFFLLWESQGSKDTKATLDRQLYHDFLVTYSLKDGKYNISLEGLNLTNARLYDNFSLQKPGRSLSVKLRYYFNKRQIKSQI